MEIPLLGFRTRGFLIRFLHYLAWKLSRVTPPGLKALRVKKRYPQHHLPIRTMAKTPFLRSQTAHIQPGSLSMKIPFYPYIISHYREF